MNDIIKYALMAMALLIGTESVLAESLAIDTTIQGISKLNGSAENKVRVGDSSNISESITAVNVIYGASVQSWPSIFMEPDDDPNTPSDKQLQNYGALVNLVELHTQSGIPWQYDSGSVGLTGAVGAGQFFRSDPGCIQLSLGCRGQKAGKSKG